MYDWMDSSIEQANTIFQEFSLDWKFLFNSGAGEDQITKCESELNLSLPRSYQEFLLRHNGVHLFYNELEERSDSSSWWAGSGVKIFGTTDLLSYRHYRQETSSPYSESEDQSMLIFTYLGRIGTGDSCALDTAKFSSSECPVLDCDHDYPSSIWKETPIASSFEEWLIKMFDRIINHKSLPEYWYSDTSNDNSLEVAGSSIGSV